MSATIQASSYLLYECPLCRGEVVLEGDAGFLHGHGVCIPCSYTERGFYRGSVYLRFLGRRENPVKLTRGTAREDLIGVGLGG